MRRALCPLVVIVCLTALGTPGSQAQTVTATTLYSFCNQGGVNCTDGDTPNTGMIAASDGNYYGVTLSGGNDNSACSGGNCGTVFKLIPSGTLTTLHKFCATVNGNQFCTDGAPPNSLIQGSDGNFYGTTGYIGGA